MPDRPTDDIGSEGDGAWVSLNSEIPKPEKSNAVSATALVSTHLHDGAVARHQHGDDTRPTGQLVTLPYNPKRVFNSVYQRETGHIFADPHGMGEMENRDGLIVNLRR